MNEMTAPSCPGCHFRCQLDRYQCGRGARFFAQWQETGEVPQRHGHPGPPPGKEPSPDQRLMFELNIVAHAMQMQREQQAETELLASLAAHEGSSTGHVLEKRARLQPGTFGAAIGQLEHDGLVERCDLGQFHDAFCITDAGKARLSELEAARTAANEEFLSPLSAEERDQLAALLGKLLAPAHARAHGHGHGAHGHGRK